MQKNKKTFALIYGLNFLIALAWALPTYIESSYLGLLFAVRWVSPILLAATVATFVAVFFYPRYIRRYTNFRAMLIALAATTGALFVLATTQDRWVVLIIFMAYYVTATLLAINIDVFLEDISDDARTGRIRGYLLTIANAAWVIAPVMMGGLVGDANYRRAFLAGGLVLIPAILILFSSRNAMSDRYRYRNRPLKRLVRIVRGNVNLKCIFTISLILRFYYFITAMYVPLYLHYALGFHWITIGWILTVMLLPYVFLQVPAGWISDRWLGEQELLVGGLAIITIFTGLIYFTTSGNPMVWAFLLFSTRIGTALVEAMTEIYFFKQINRRDVDLINLFRNLWPFGWLLASLFAALMLLFLPLPYLFLFSTIALSFAIVPALTLRDTR